MVDHIIEEADRLYNKGQYREVYEYLKKHKTSQNCNILSRLAQATRDFAVKVIHEKEKRKELIEEALNYAKEALGLDENNSEANKWFAITTNDIGDYDGIKAKASNMLMVRKHLQQALAINPNDALALHHLGLWCFEYADLDLMARKIVAQYLSPSQWPTFVEALNYFKQAEETKPKFYSINLKMLAKTYQSLNDRVKAKFYYQETLSYNVMNEEDKEVVKYCKEQLKSY